LHELGLIDGIIPEPAGGAQEDPDVAAEFVRQHLSARLSELDHLDGDQIVEHRYAKFRRMGNFFA
jgi:acetyl-CoA carboxylase carboxyl transferase subunit alpha